MVFTDQQSWLFKQDGKRATINTQKVKKYIQDNLGVCLLEGIGSEPEISPYALRQEGDLSSFMNIGIGYRINHEKYNYLSWLTEKIPDYINQDKVAFIFCFGCGNGRPYSQPMGWYDLFLNGEKILSFRAVQYTQIFRKNECQLALRVVRTCFAGKDQILHLDQFTDGDSWASFGSAVLEVPTSKVTLGKPAQIKIQACSFFPSKRWFRIDMMGRFWEGRLLNEINSVETVKLLKCKRKIPFLEKSDHYFGDLHAHSDCGFKAACGYNSLPQIKNRNCSNCNLSRGGNGCGYGTIIHNYEFARSIANLDFFCLADHGFQIFGKEDWKLRVNFAKNSSEENQFISVPGYEFTSLEEGHRNIYFGEYKGRMIPSRSHAPNTKYDNLKSAQLWKKLENQQVPFLSIPHHTSVICHAFDWTTFNPKYDRLVEVFSGWGDHWDAEGYLRGNGSDKALKLTVKKMFEKNVRFGIIASSDCHDGCPGAAQARPSGNWSNKYSRVGSGLAVVRTDNLTLKNIFHSLYERRCYGTTGIHAIVDFRINDYPMGSHVTTSKNNMNLNLTIKSPLNIRKIKIFRNRELKKRIFTDAKHEDLQFHDNIKEKRTASYIAIIDFDGYERVWCSPITIVKE